MNGSKVYITVIWTWQSKKCCSLTFASTPCSFSLPILTSLFQSPHPDKIYSLQFKKKKKPLLTLWVANGALWPHGTLKDLGHLWNGTVIVPPKSCEMEVPSVLTQEWSLLLPNFSLKSCICIHDYYYIINFQHLFKKVVQNMRSDYQHVEFIFTLLQLCCKKEPITPGLTAFYHQVP